MTKTRKEKREKFKKEIAGARKVIRQYIIMMVGLFIGWHVATGFLKIDAGMVNDSIVFGLAMIIIVLLVFNAIKINQAKKLLENNPRQEKPKADRFIKYYDGKARKYKYVKEEAPQDE